MLLVDCLCYRLFAYVTGCLLMLQADRCSLFTMENAYKKKREFATVDGRIKLVFFFFLLLDGTVKLSQPFLVKTPSKAFCRMKNKAFEIVKM